MELMLVVYVYLYFYVKLWPTHKPVDPSRCAGGPPTLYYHLCLFSCFIYLLEYLYLRLSSQSRDPTRYAGGPPPTLSHLCHLVILLVFLSILPKCGQRVGPGDLFPAHGLVLNEGGLGILHDFTLMIIV